MFVIGVSDSGADVIVVWTTDGGGVGVGAAPVSGVTVPFACRILSRQSLISMMTHPFVQSQTSNQTIKQTMIL